MGGKGRELARTSWLPHVRGDWDVSPDGSQIALPYRNPLNRKIRIVSLNHQPEKEITVKSSARLNGLTWAANGEGWYMATQTDVGSFLLYVALTGEARILRSFAGGPTWGAPSPDQRQLAFVDQTVNSNVWLKE